MTSGRMTEYLVQGFGSKNNRTRVDCVELLREIVEEEGMTACMRNKQKPFAAVAEVRVPLHWQVLNGIQDFEG